VQKQRKLRNGIENAWVMVDEYHALQCLMAEMEALKNNVSGTRTTT
jgi:hypothetical protein